MRRLHATAIRGIPAAPLPPADASGAVGGEPCFWPSRAGPHQPSAQPATHCPLPSG